MVPLVREHTEECFWKVLLLLAHKANLYLTEELINIRGSCNIFFFLVQIAGKTTGPNWI